MYEGKKNKEKKRDRGKNHLLKKKEKREKKILNTI
jgi:hypothetical protein